MALTYRASSGFPPYDVYDAHVTPSVCLTSRSITSEISRRRSWPTWVISLVLAHQHLGQLPRDMRNALGANARNKIVFTCSPEDATALERRRRLLSALWRWRKARRDGQKMSGGHQRFGLRNPRRTVEANISLELAPAPPRFDSRPAQPTRSPAAHSRGPSVTAPLVARNAGVPGRGPRVERQVDPRLPSRSATQRVLPRGDPRLRDRSRPPPRARSQRSQDSRGWLATRLPHE